MLQVELYTMNSNRDSVLHADTESTQLPTQTCKIAHQNKFFQMISNYTKTLNFTIVVEPITSCELFLTTSACQFRIYEAFCIEISTCPVGFTLQN